MDVGTPHAQLRMMTIVVELEVIFHTIYQAQHLRCTLISRLCVMRTRTGACSPEAHAQLSQTQAQTFTLPKINDVIAINTLFLTEIVNLDNSVGSAAIKRIETHVLIRIFTWRF